PAGPYAPVLGGQDVAATSFVDTGLENGATYYYTVRATNPFGASGPSTEVTGVPGFVGRKIATGDMHSLALLADGSLWAWGDNVNGQLGVGTSLLFSNVARQVPLDDVVDIA